MSYAGNRPLKQCDGHVQLNEATAHSLNLTAGNP